MALTWFSHRYHVVSCQNWATRMTNIRTAVVALLGLALPCALGSEAKCVTVH